jgi:hypothetical protein
MRVGAMPVLWLYGPPGVGRSTVGWELFARLTAEGTPVRGSSSCPGSSVRKSGRMIQLASLHEQTVPP